MVVQNSKELDAQRKLFLESMSLAVSIVKPRTSSHQAIAETLDELQVCAELFINNLNSLIYLFLCHLHLYLLDCLKSRDVDYDQQNLLLSISLKIQQSKHHRHKVAQIVINTLFLVLFLLFSFFVFFLCFLKTVANKIITLVYCQ